MGSGQGARLLREGGERRLIVVLVASPSLFSCASKSGRGTRRLRRSQNCMGAATAMDGRQGAGTQQQAGTVSWMVVQARKEKAPKDGGSRTVTIRGTSGAWEMVPGSHVPSIWVCLAAAKRSWAVFSGFGGEERCRSWRQNTTAARSRCRVAFDDDTHPANFAPRPFCTVQRYLGVSVLRPQSSRLYCVSLLDLSPVISAAASRLHARTAASCLAPSASHTIILALVSPLAHHFPKAHSTRSKLDRHRLPLSLSIPRLVVCVCPLVFGGFLAWNMAWRRARKRILCYPGAATEALARKLWEASAPGGFSDAVCLAAAWPDPAVITPRAKVLRRRPVAQLSRASRHGDTPTA